MSVALSESESSPAPLLSSSRAPEYRRVGLAYRGRRSDRRADRRHRALVGLRAPFAVWLGGLVVALSLLIARPAFAEEDAWVGPDKALHFGASSVIASGSYAVSTLLFDARGHSLLFGAGVSALVGGGKEAFDAVGLGTPSWRDLAWDAAGTIVGLGVAYVVDLLVRGLPPRHPLFVRPRSPSSASHSK